MVIAGANVVDQKLLEATIEAIVVERPDPKKLEQNLCLDKGYYNPTGHDVTKRHGYVAHIRPIGEDRRGVPARSKKAPPVGSGANPGLVVEMPSTVDPLRQA